MGGGTVMRVAGKISRINGAGGGGGASGLISSVKSLSLPEQYMSTTTTTTTSPNRTSSKNVSVVTNEDGSGSVKPASVLLSDSSSSSIHRCLGIDDWEFASVEEEEEILFDSMNPIPRIVFGRVPTMGEAEEATSQLKQVLDTVYVDATHKVNSSIPVKQSTPSVDYSSGYTETSACVTPSQNLVARTSISNPVLQAFSLLQSSPECQDAVASIASDKIIWEAVMRNPKVQDFIRSRQASGAVLTDMDNMEDANNSFLDNEKASDCVHNEDDEKHDEEDTTNVFTELMQKIKVAVTDMSSNLYGIVLSIIGGPKEENVSLDSKGAAAAATAIEKSTTASLMALAVMAIMVILLKRV